MMLPKLPRHIRAIAYFPSSVSFRDRYVRLRRDVHLVHLLKDNDIAQRLAPLHRLDRFVDLFQRVAIGDQLVEQ